MAGPQWISINQWVRFKRNNARISFYQMQDWSRLKLYYKISKFPLKFIFFLQWKAFFLCYPNYFCLFFFFFFSPVKVWVAAVFVVIVFKFLYNCSCFLLWSLTSLPLIVVFVVDKLATNSCFCGCYRLFIVV